MVFHATGETYFRHASSDHKVVKLCVGGCIMVERSFDGGAMKRLFDAVLVAVLALSLAVPAGFARAQQKQTQTQSQQPHATPPHSPPPHTTHTLQPPRHS